MQLQSLILKNYRNYQTLTIEFSPQINIFIGKNAQGKTNLMEAIYVLALAKSHRTNQHKELILFDQQESLIQGQLNYRFGQLDLSLLLTKQGKKAKINHLEQSKLSQYIGQMNIVLFAPEDLILVKGTPQDRRKFINRECGQISATYLHDLVEFNKILKQRNSYLKQLQIKQQQDITLLDILTEQFIESAIKITKKRENFIKKLQQLAQPIHAAITQQQEQLKLIYYPSLKNLDKNIILDEMKAVYALEIKRGVSQLGPQRDDFGFFINDMNVQIYGSQGQQRTTALSLKLAEIELIYQEIGEYPILLLDDVLSELDESRQTHLLNTIEDKVQTFVTTPSIKDIEHRVVDKAKLFMIKNGEVIINNK